jgi:hypothetical protein
MGELGLTQTTGPRGFPLGLGYRDHFWRSVARRRYFLVRSHRPWRGGISSFERAVRLRRRRKCRCLYPVYLCPEDWLHPSDLSVSLGPELIELGLKDSAHFVRASPRPRDLCLNLVWELSCEFVLYTARCLGWELSCEFVLYTARCLGEFVLYTARCLAKASLTKLGSVATCIPFRTALSINDGVSRERLAQRTLETLFFF